MDWLHKTTNQYYKNEFPFLAWLPPDVGGVAPNRVTKSRVFFLSFLHFTLIVVYFLFCYSVVPVV